MSTAPQFGVVVVNWNGAADTVTCLESLRRAVPPPARVIVVDNGSTDGSVAALQRWASEAIGSNGPRFTLLATDANRGFSAANNVGLRRLAADSPLTHFLLLNNDATVAPDFFAALRRALKRAPDTALLGVTIRVTGRPSDVWYAGGRFLRLRSLVLHGRRVPPDDAPVPTEFVTGCALVISRVAWQTLGPLPECYFVYSEDAEYSHRALAAGLPVRYAPEPVAYHAVGATVRRLVATPKVERWKVRGRTLWVRRNLRGAARWGALGYLLVTKPVRAGWETVAGRPRLAQALLAGLAEGLLAEQDNARPREAAAVEHAVEHVIIDQ